MAFPPPAPGMVISYAFLWAKEADAGRVESAKDRPCAIVLTRDDAATGRPIITVLPITHREPAGDTVGVELPQATKRRLGLDAERSWIVLTELNRFTWPGPDLRVITKGKVAAYHYGYLPKRLFDHLKQQLIELAKERRVKTTPRTA